MGQRYRHRRLLREAEALISRLPIRYEGYSPGRYTVDSLMAVELTLKALEIATGGPVLVVVGGAGECCRSDHRLRGSFPGQDAGLAAPAAICSSVILSASEDNLASADLVSGVAREASPGPRPGQ